MVKTVLKNDLSKFIFMILVGSFTLSLLAFGLTIFIAANVKDIMFVVGLFLTIGAVFSMIEGRSSGTESICHPESPFITSENYNVTKIDKEKLMSSIYMIDKVKSTLLSTEFVVIGIILLTISYII